MDKLLVHILLLLFVKDKSRIKMAIDVLFGKNTPKVINDVKVVNTVKVVKDEVVNKPKPVNNKRDEIMDAINYLKSKSNKTKSDREKIQMLEVVLKSARVN